MKRYGLMFIYLAVCCVMMSSCSMLPQEETFPQAPVIESYERESYTLFQVRRGDLALQKKISCSYTSLQTQTLSYDFSGENFAEVFVSAGDSVQPGQLLAQLDVSQIEWNLSQCELQIEKLGVSIAAIEENRALALARERILHSTSSAAQLREALKNVEAQYDAQKRRLTDEMSIIQLQKKEYEQQIAARQLRAEMAGVVTYIKQTEPGAKSVKGEMFITIADPRSLFRADTKYWQSFEVGQRVTITIGQSSYEAVIASEEELGLPAAEKTEGKNARVYFRLENPDFNLEDGQQGTIAFIQEARENVLLVDKRALSKADGQTIVYYPDEEGMKRYKAVETGLEANGMVEILSGLEEGEMVIID